MLDGSKADARAPGFRRAAHPSSYPGLVASAAPQLTVTVTVVARQSVERPGPCKGDWRPESLSESQRAVVLEGLPWGDVLRGELSRMSYRRMNRGGSTHAKQLTTARESENSSHSQQKL